MFKVYPWHLPVVTALARAATRERLGHAWLLHGPPGVGKRHLAETLGGALIEGLPPQDWARCMGSDLGPDEAPVVMLPDLHRLAPMPDKRSIGVEQIRELGEQLSLTSHAARARVAVIVPAEQMTTSAANSLLKTLEEPPAGTYLLLVSHQPGRLPPTIRSRCQRLPVACPERSLALEWLTAQTPSRDWTLLLDLAQGSPLGATRLAELELDTLDPLWCAGLAELVENPSKLSASVDEWLKLDAGVYLSWLQGRLECVLRDLAAENAAPAALHPAYAALLSACRNGSLARLMALRDGVVRLRAFADGGVNLTLGLEALLVCWLKRT